MCFDLDLTLRMPLILFFSMPVVSQSQVSILVLIPGINLISPESLAAHKLITK